MCNLGKGFCKGFGSVNFNCSVREIVLEVSGWHYGRCICTWVASRLQYIVIISLDSFSLVSCFDFGLLVFVKCLKDNMPIYSKHKMTAMKKPEDLTLDEVREQMALYQRLYYKLRMQDPDPDYATALQERKRLSKQRTQEAKGGQVNALPNQKYSMEHMAVM